MSDEPFVPVDPGGEPAGGIDKAVVRADVRKDVAQVTAPIVVDLGKQRRRLVKQLARGEGPLMAEVAAVIDEVRKQLDDELNGKVLVPLVMVCRQKRKRKPTPTLLPTR